MSLNYYLQVAAMFFIPLLAVVLPIIIGLRYGIAHGKVAPGLTSAPIGNVVTAALGLVGFMLAFTFQMANNRYERRKELMLEEVSNIRTTFLRASLLPEPYNSGARKNLREYVSLRTGLSKNQANLQRTIIRSQEILDTCWRYAEQLVARDKSSEVYALYIESVNNIVSNFNQRITMGTEYRIPSAVYVALFIITFLSMMAFGYHFGLYGKSGFKLTFLFAIIFAVVIFLILILDYPQMGIIKVNPKPMLKLHEQLLER